VFALILAAKVNIVINRNSRRQPKGVRREQQYRKEQAAESMANQIKTAVDKAQEEAVKVMDSLV
jgi:hypothetical protein